MPTSDFSSQFRDVRAETFVGRDLYQHIEVHLTGAQAQESLDQLLPLLRRADVGIADGVVSSQGDRLAIDSAHADALVKYITAGPTEDAAEREQAYLTRLCLDTGLRRIYSRYVPLSGGYRPVRELSPTYSRILVRGDGPQRTIERVRLDDIRQAVTEHPAFILLAQPGAGKTTVLQRLALEMALKRLREGGDALLPLFVRLASQKVDEAPIDFLGRMWREEAPGLHTDPAGEVTLALRQGRLCLLCDALNEARREKFRERLMEWADFARQLPAGNRLLFTCRTQDYSGGLAVQQVEVDPLSPEQIEEFARLYLGKEKGAGLWGELQRGHSDLLDLAKIPYYLLLMTEAYAAAGRLPKHRAGLFASFVERLLLREMEEKRHAEWIDPAAQNLALGRLAFAMQELGTGTQVDTAWALAAIPQSVSIDGQTIVTRPETVMRLGTAANLLALPDGDAVRFIHHLLQEYFAAEELLRRHNAGEGLTDLWTVPSLAREMPNAVRGEYDPLPEPPTSGWEQTTILASGLYPALIDTIQPVNPALAARCLLELGVDAGAAQRERSQTALLERLGNVAIHLRSRMEAGLLLGRLGDPRFLVETVKGVSVIVPSMVEIAAATTTIGSAWWDFGAFNDEKPRHKVQLAAYAIGRYPVTNAEYECFLRAGGYTEERYWSAGGKYWLKGEPVPGEEDPADWWIETWKRRKANPKEIEERLKANIITEHEARNWRNYITWSEEQWQAAVVQLYPQGEAVREPRYWQDIAYNNPSQPVVGVCWYEAVAYANWLAEITDQLYRLPTEPEWEWAARRDGRIFPWGKGWDETKLNSLEGRVMRTTPVGAYPHGTTPDGIHDLAGNVWEWTATRYAPYPYDPDAHREDLDATGPRIARGGGWSGNRKMVRCACRFRRNAWHWSYNRGYRLARACSR